MSLAAEWSQSDLEVRGSTSGDRQVPVPLPLPVVGVIVRQDAAFGHFWR